MPAIRRCRVPVRDVEGVTHTVDVQAATLFEAAAAAIAAFRQDAWAADALTPNAVVRVEVQIPAVVHDVPVKVIERWTRSSTTSPTDFLVKQANRRNPAQ